MSHGDKITAMPPGFEVVATSDNSPYAVIADEKRTLLRRAVSSRSGAHPARRDNAVAISC